MPNKSLFARIVKIDAATRSVSGIAMQEVVDRTNEICDYEKSKPFFKAWSANQEKASGGKSKGNVRAMHNSKVAGIVTELACDDDLKAFLIDTRIVADDEWALCESGAYTGFSIGANFAKGHKVTTDPDGAMRWVADPMEVSLVDIPCVPTALFELKDAAGEVHMRKFLNAERSKSMYSVSQMASAMSDIGWMLTELDWEKQWEGDDSNIPDRLRAWLNEGATIFLDLTTEESTEFAQMITAQKATRADRVKAAQPQTTEHDDMTADQEKAFNAGIETIKTLGPTLEALKGMPDTLKGISDAQTKFATDLKAQGEELGTLKTQVSELAELKSGLEALEAAFGEQPEAPKTKSAAATIPRDNDTGNGQAATPEAPQFKSSKQSEQRDERLAAIKAAHASTQQPGFGGQA